MYTGDETQVVFYLVISIDSTAYLVSSVGVSVLERVGLKSEWDNILPFTCNSLLVSLCCLLLDFCDRFLTFFQTEPDNKVVPILLQTLLTPVTNEAKSPVWRPLRDSAIPENNMHLST